MAVPGLTPDERVRLYAELERLGVRTLLEDKLRDEHVATLDDATGPSRETHVLAARATLVGYFHDRGWSLPSIAKLLGKDRRWVDEMILRLERSRRA